MATKRDYYDVLGVSKNATEAEIKRAYRQQALKWHPDKNKSAEASVKFKEVTEAYEILADQEKRKTYDQFGHAAFDQAAGANPFGGGWSNQPFTYSYSTKGGQSSGFDFGGFSDPFEIFEAFFGGGSPFRQQRALTRYGLTLSFDEAVKGTYKTIIHKGKEHKIKIPAGVYDGSRIKFSDFYVSIDVKPSDTFKREGYDLIIDKKISFALAALGGQIEVPTIDKPVKLKIRAGTQPLTFLRLRGQGVPHPRGHGRGDLYIRLVVEVPTKLNREQKNLIQAMDRAF